MCSAEVESYQSADEVPDEVILTAFALADTVRFSARRFNTIAHRSIGIGDIGWWLPLSRVMPLLGITPQMLRPAFNFPRIVVKKRHFPFGINFFGLNRIVDLVEVNGLSETIDTYDQLGAFCIEDEPLKAFARILGKTIEVWREDGGSGEHYLLLTVTPGGAFIEPDENG